MLRLRRTQGDRKARWVSFEEALHSEIEKIYFFEELPTEWTYPQVHPKLIAEAERIVSSGKKIWDKKKDKD